MKIWVDADSCPVKVREIISRAALRVKKKAVFVANIEIPFSKNDFTEMVIVDSGEGVADDYIVKQVKKGDLCITRDIPLADRLINCEAVVLNDRGNQFTIDNIKQRLSIRDFMAELRFNNLESDKHGSFSNKDLQKFAAAFDRELAKLLN